MTKNQIHNIFYYLGIMLNDNKIIYTSPDYLIEKSMTFFNKLGKNIFICDIENNYKKQEIDYDMNFWSKYCEIWKINKQDFELLNIINFILNSNINNTKNVIKNFEKYIGNIDIISDSDLSFKLHPILRSHINNSINFDSRYLKLISF